MKDEVYEFEWQDSFVGTVRSTKLVPCSIVTTKNGGNGGTNGNTNDDKQQEQDETSENCSSGTPVVVLEIAAKNSDNGAKKKKQWKRVFHKEDLDGVILTDLSQIISAFQQALETNNNHDESASSPLKPTLFIESNDDDDDEDNNNGKRANVLAVSFSFPLCLGFITVELLLDPIQENHDNTTTSNDDPTTTTTTAKERQRLIQQEEVEFLRARLQQSKLREGKLQTQMNHLKSDLISNVDDSKLKILMKKESELRVEMDDLKVYLESGFQRESKLQTDFNLIKEQHLQREQVMQQHMQHRQEQEQQTQEQQQELQDQKQQLQQQQQQHEQLQSELQQQQRQQEQLQSELQQQQEQQEKLQVELQQQQEQQEQFQAELEQQKQQQENFQIEMQQRQHQPQEQQQQEHQLVLRKPQEDNDPPQQKALLLLEDGNDIEEDETQQNGPIQQERESKKKQQQQRFVAHGHDLCVSRCGQIVSHKGSYGNNMEKSSRFLVQAEAVPKWRTAIVGEKMPFGTGIYYAEFMTLRMDSDYRVIIGMLPSSQILSSMAQDDNEAYESLVLNDSISFIQGGFRFYAYNGSAHKYGDGDSMDADDGRDTDLPGCQGSQGPVVIGMLYNSDSSSVQFFLNGMESTVFSNILPPKNVKDYSFAISLRNQYEAIRLLKIENYPSPSGEQDLAPTPKNNNDDNNARGFRRRPK